VVAPVLAMTRSTSARHLVRTLLAGLLALAGAGVAYAQARVVVEVREPGGGIANGQITLRAASGSATHTCTTQGGYCEIASVAGGQYYVTLRPRSGEAPPPRTVVIPPAGRVTLRVSTR